MDLMGVWGSDFWFCKEAGNCHVTYAELCGVRESLKLTAERGFPKLWLKVIS